MKFLRSRILNIIIIIMSVLAIAAVIIGIRVSITMVKRHNQMLGRLPSEQKVAVQGVTKPASIGALKDQTFYLNGEDIGALAYLTGRQEVYVPIDAVLGKLGIRFKSYSSDDIIETTINGKKLLVTLGKNVYKYGNNEINLQSIPVAAKNHILVPVELFQNFDGFIYTPRKDKDTSFLNYWPGFYTSFDKSIKVLNIVGKNPGVCDILGRTIVNYKNSLGEAEKIVAAPDNSKFLIISGNKVYLGTKEKGTIPCQINVPAKATWSADSEYLYWIDDRQKTSYVYDLEEKKIERLGDYYFQAVTGGEGGIRKYAGRMLYVYKKGPGYKRIVLTNATNDSKYCFIERNGKTVVKGELYYSPDKTKILYMKSDNYYYLSNLDGTRQVCLGSCDIARWVDNDKIFIRDGDKSFIYSRTDREKEEVSDEWYKVGQTESGDVFFMHGDNLYCESDWVERKVMMITGGCDYVYALSRKGPYIIVSQKEDNILYLNGETIKYMGKYSSLLENIKDGEVYTDIENNIVTSPDKKTIVIFQKNKDFISLNAVNADGTNSRNIFLSYNINSDTDICRVMPVWTKNDRLLVYTDKKLWLIDLKGSRVFEWAERGNNAIQGILR